MAQAAVVDVVFATAILQGTKERYEKTGKATILIHTSGTGEVSDNAQGLHSADVVYSDLDVPLFEALPPSQPHRKADLAILAADNEVRALIEASIARKQGDVVREGKNHWPNVDMNERPSSSSPDLADTKPVFVSVLGLVESDIQDDAEFEPDAIEALHTIQTKHDIELPSNLLELHTTAKAVKQYISFKGPGKSPKPVEEKAMDLDKEENLSDLTFEQVQSVVRVLRLDEVPISVQKSSSRSRIPALPLP
ncbi:hypothetical protein EDD85DRAFT_792965 [Armillaria nabsnona]|nr:hypothetical protein EDD85DRAFT_792965 [Armillaria nabsnona]